MFFNKIFNFKNPKWNNQETIKEENARTPKKTKTTKNKEILKNSKKLDSLKEMTHFKGLEKWKRTTKMQSLTLKNEPHVPIKNKEVAETNISEKIAVLRTNMMQMGYLF